MNLVLCDAIKRRVLVELHYDGFQRVVEPYRYGDNADGHGLALVYQIEGGSLSRQRLGWKLLRVDEMSGLVSLDRTFEPRWGYRQGDRSMKIIHCQV